MYEQTTKVAGSYRSLADDATKMACTMLEKGLKARASRFEDIRKSEDMYAGKTGPALRGRNNVPFDTIVMGGYIDTLRANTDEQISIKFGPSREQDKMASDKMTAVWERESAPDKGAWNDTMLDIKFLASLSGRGFAKLFVESAPKFRTDLEVCDHYDMVTEALGGGDLDKHLYKFQMNIFRSWQDLKDGSADGFYDKAQIIKLRSASNDAEVAKKFTEALYAKNLRWASFGIDVTMDGVVGTSMFRLTEGAIFYKGRWYYILFNYETQIWVRFQPLDEVFYHAKYFPGRASWASFATHRHPFLFWTKAPADDIRPIGYAMKKIVNLTLDNLEKRNWDMTAYDPKIFTEPNQLLWRQDGIVRASLKPGQNINNGIYKFQTPDTTNITIDLASWIDTFVGKKTGISDDAQGASKSSRVGINVSNLQQTSKRMTLANKMYRKMQADLGSIFDYGVYDNLREPYAVKILGPMGLRWQEEITQKEADCDFAITVTSAADDDERNLENSEKRGDIFTAIENNPIMLGQVNMKWHLEERYKDAGYTDEEVRIALDRDSDIDQEGNARAAELIQAVLDGSDSYSLYRNATTGFVSKILNFAADKYPLYSPEMLKTMKPSERKRYAEKMKQYDRLMAIASLHMPLVQKNMERKAINQIIQSRLAQAMNPQPATKGAPAAPGGAPAPVAPASPMNAQ